MTSSEVYLTELLTQDKVQLHKNIYNETFYVYYYVSLLFNYFTIKLEGTALHLTQPSRSVLRNKFGHPCRNKLDVSCIFR